MPYIEYYTQYAKKIAGGHLASRLRKNPGTDGSVHGMVSHLTDSTSTIRDRFVCPRVFPQPAKGKLKCPIVNHQPGSASFSASTGRRSF